jgi:fumarylacetoacetate (FAA) hydrolase family protein
MSHPARFLFVFMIGCALIIGATKCHAQASPTPFSISDAELKKISRADIVKTVKHMIALSKEQ